MLPISAITSLFKIRLRQPHVHITAYVSSTETLSFYKKVTEQNLLKNAEILQTITQYLQENSICHPSTHR